MDKSNMKVVIQQMNTDDGAMMLRISTEELYYREIRISALSLQNMDLSKVEQIVGRGILTALQYKLPELFDEDEALAQLDV